MKIPVKIGDVFVYCLIVLLVAGSFLGIYRLRMAAVEIQVMIEIDGRVVSTHLFPAEGGLDRIRADVGNGRFNVIAVAESGVEIEEANCPDQLCVRWGTIRFPGQTIVCLPHRVVVRIIGNGAVDPEVDDIAS